MAHLSTVDPADRFDQSTEKSNFGRWTLVINFDTAEILEESPLYAELAASLVLEALKTNCVVRHTMLEDHSPVVTEDPSLYREANERF